MAFIYVLLQQYNDFPYYKRKFWWLLYILSLIVSYICVTTLSWHLFVFRSA